MRRNNIMMAGIRKNVESIIIPVSLDEPLTSHSCTKLIIELLKYILYQKQQIPFSYDTLALMQTRLNPNDRNSTSTKILMRSLKNIAENLTCQLYSSDCRVREVVIIIGATTVSPRLCIRIELPDVIFHNHQHSSRKPLLNLMKSIHDCREFQEAMTVPLGVTNTFVLLKKRDINPSDFFLPKPCYVPPSQTTTCFVIKFNKNSSITTHDCNCTDTIKVYRDSPHDCPSDINTNMHHEDSPYLWYQSREVIKGFKYAR